MRNPLIHTKCDATAIVSLYWDALSTTFVKIVFVKANETHLASFEAPLPAVGHYEVSSGIALLISLKP